MLLPNLDWNSPKAIALQLQEQLREHLENHTLRAGERLPSTRHLAEWLGIHRSMVAQVDRPALIPPEGSPAKSRT